MSTYLYRCRDCGAEENVQHRMTAAIRIVCSCGHHMHRVPQPIAGVNWGQLKPSQGDYPRVYDELMATKAEREEKFYTEKKHVENPPIKGQAKADDKDG